MVPVAVSVPDKVVRFDVSMHFDNWAFGEFEGKPLSSKVKEYERRFGRP